MILGLPITCSYKQFSSSSCKWNEWIRFPVRICDISRDTQIVFTIYSVSTSIEGKGKCCKQIIGGVTIPLFEQRILRFGHYKLRIKDGYHGDGSIDSQTLFTKLNRQLTIRDQIQSKITEKAMKQIPKVPYLDALTNRRLTKINSSSSQSQSQIQIASSHNGIYLEIDLPNFGYKVVYQEKTNGKKAFHSRREQRNRSRRDVGGGNNDDVKSNRKYHQSHKSAVNKNRNIEDLLICINDPETKLTNPVLEKNQKLSQHLDLYDDHDARPTVSEQKRLQDIIKLFDMSNVTEGDKNLLWKYRKYLVDNKYALTKFLRIINQSNENEVEMAVNLMDKWAPIDVAHALELLSGHFICAQFRKYGIDVLRKHASDQDLELYIMQLVQAIRFESWLDKTSLSELELFLLERCLASESFSLLNFLYWSAVVASQSEDDDDNTFNERYLFFLKMIEKETKEKREDYYEELERQKWLIGELIELSTFIGNVDGKADDKKAKLRHTVTKGKFKGLSEFEKGVLMPLRPNIRVTGIFGPECSVFRSAMAPLRIAFKFHKDTKFKSMEDPHNNVIPEEKQDKPNNNMPSIDETHNRLGTVGSEYTDATDISQPQSRRGSSIDSTTNNKVKKQTQNKRIRTQLTDLDNDEYYQIIWKNGDDLRRDQLIIQMIHLMDNLLMDFNLDLCLTPYPVLATGVDHGMMEFVPNSPTVGGILLDSKYNNNLKSFIEEKSNGKPKEFAKMQDRFTKSLAGYCVITYLLGVGDRHLDNILLTHGGYLFHIDFGYIYGEEPPMKGTISPKIRIIKQMIDVMGGYQSIKYQTFQKYIRSSYGRLRKMAPLILNLLSLIGQGSMQKIEENIRFVYSRFALEINEDLAANELLRIVEEAANSIWTTLLIDAPHNYATKHK